MYVRDLISRSGNERREYRYVTVMDKETFVKLINEYSINMYRISYGILHSGADAEDAVSEAVLRAYENLHTLKKTESFKSWIMQITVNEARKIYRKSQKITPIEQVSDMTPAFFDDYHELWDVVMKLEEIYREVIILYFYEQLSLREISKVLHIAEGTVKSRLFRGKKNLKEML